MAADPERAYGSVLRFFSKPAIGITGSVASIVGVILAVYFFTAGGQTRDLRYFVHPAKAVVVKTGQSSRLRVTLDGAPVERDVTAAQVAFWNEGGEPIHQGNMLQPFVIRTAPNARILEAAVRKTRREVSGITLDLARLADGEVRVNWTILERNDGGVLQLIYLGDADSPISATGIVEGQGEVRALAFGGDPDQYRRLSSLAPRLTGYANLLMGIMLGFLAVYLVSRRRHLSFLSKCILLGGPTIIIAMSLYMIIWLCARPGPPFGFD
jgi:hypothetical protein